MFKQKKPLGRLFFVMAIAMVPMSVTYADTCYWKDGKVGPIHYDIGIGTHYVPRDVRRSTPIGPVDKRYGPVGGGGLAIDCHTSGPRINFMARNHQPMAPGSFEPINGEDVTGKIIATNIDGVGVRVKLAGSYTFWDFATDNFTVPYDAYIARYMPNVFSHSLLMPLVTLVKTGDIAPGAHNLSVPDLLGGEFTGIGNGFNMSLTGTVIQAECSVSSNPVSADPVDLGAWDHSVFTHVNYATTATPFNITLNSCVADNRTPPETITYAHIRLDPTAGSAIHDSLAGQLTLGTGSTAKGVVIQMLHDDDTPVTLASAVRLKPITPGSTMLSFKARLYQTEPPGRVEAGVAKGSLSFTITYL